MKFGKATTALIFLAFNVSSNVNAFSIGGKSTIHKSIAYGNNPMMRTSSSVVSSSRINTFKNSQPIGSMNTDFHEAQDTVIATIKAAVDIKSMEDALIYFTSEYFHASYDSFKNGNENASAKSTAEIMLKSIKFGYQHGVAEKYIFGTTHTALLGEKPDEEDGNTINYYDFGNDFFRPVIEIENSPLLGRENLVKATDQIKAGENVVFFANHQSEADPQVMSLVLEKAGFAEEAQGFTYVAGHKVTTDPLAIPFSMGRNLICIHSKKHINNDPDTKTMKQKQNLAAMSGMLTKLRKGGTTIWVAPSGGRDRKNLESGNIPIAAFDPKTVDMFRLLGNKCKVNTHYYSVSMVSYELCPPPDSVVSNVGEVRNIRYGPVGLYISEELGNEGGVDSRKAFTEKAFTTCERNYNTLLESMK